MADKAAKQKNNQDTSFKARKPSDKKLGSFGGIFKQKKNERPTT